MMNEVMAASENLRFTTQIAILKGKMMENSWDLKG